MGTRLETGLKAKAIISCKAKFYVQFFNSITNIWLPSMLLDLLLLLVSTCHAKIVREECFFDANFSLVFHNQRMLNFRIQNETVINTHDCVSMCILNGECQSINYHLKMKICELLNKTKFDSGANIDSDDGWVHYETDPDNFKVSKFFFL